MYLPTPLNTPPKRCHQASTPLAVADPEAIARIEGPEFSPADGPLKKRKSSKDQSDEEFECKHEGCDRNFLRAADLHRHQLDRRLPCPLGSRSQQEDMLTEVRILFRSRYSHPDALMRLSGLLSFLSLLFSTGSLFPPSGATPAIP